MILVSRIRSICTVSLLLAQSLLCCGLIFAQELRDIVVVSHYTNSRPDSVGQYDSTPVYLDSTFFSQDGLRRQHIRSKWSDTFGWYIDLRLIYEYTSSSKISSVKFFDRHFDDWRLFNTQLWTYDSIDRVILIQESKSDLTAPINRWSYEYDDRGRQTSRLLERSIPGGEWNKRQLIQHTYDSSNRVRVSDTFDWNGAAWERILQYEYHYHDDFPEELASKYTLGYLSNSWTVIEWDEYIVDTNGLNIEWTHGIRTPDGRNFKEEFTRYYYYGTDGLLSVSEKRYLDELFTQKYESAYWQYDRLYSVATSIIPDKHPVYEYSLYPNPFHNTLSISGLSQNATISLYNVSGQLIHEYKGLDGNLEIPDTLPAGVYLVNISVPGAKTVRRSVVKQ